jgi:hypothetical protein
MGSLFSSNNTSKVVPVDSKAVTRLTSSAPAHLETLDGTSPKSSPLMDAAARQRAITPPDTVSKQHGQFMKETEEPLMKVSAARGH